MHKNADSRILMSRMYNRVLVFLCKILIKLLRLIGKNGSALPGLIIERLSPKFLKSTLGTVEKQIILVTGTNGKTTTTKMLVAGLRGTGVRVVTNATGSNMTRGLIAALVEDMTFFGKLRATDWFVFEMDEAYGPIFTQDISPYVVVGLNVLRDQLDRYGEIDSTARMIQETANQATVFIYNGEDPLLVRAANNVAPHDVRTVSFGVSEELRKNIIDEQVISGNKGNSQKTTHARFELTSASEEANTQKVKIAHEGGYSSVSLPAKGFHNAFNLAAVLAVIAELGVGVTDQSLMAIEQMPIPFGRGEKLDIRGKAITVALMKNPSGLVANLETFIDNKELDAILFVVNDRLADGRDVSWLWDVPFHGRINDQIKVFTSGIRAYDMALRLKQDDIPSDTVTSVSDVVELLMSSTYSNIVIVPTYTALFEVRASLAKYGKVPRIW